MKLETLTTFSEKQRNNTTNMMIYTNTNKVAEFIFSLVDVNVEVEPFRKWPTYADVFIFDERFQDLISDYNQVLHDNAVLRMRPDWGGFLMGIMKKNLSTFVFSKQWYKVWFFERTRLFRFNSCHDLVFGSNHSFLFSFKELTWLDKQAMKDVLEPLIFVAKLSASLIQNDSIEEEQRNKFTCQDGDYRKLCMNLERLLAEVGFRQVQCLIGVLHQIEAETKHGSMLAIEVIC